MSFGVMIATSSVFPTASPISRSEEALAINRNISCQCLKFERNIRDRSFYTKYFRESNSYI